MVHRQFWLDLVEKAWERKPVVWLSGVRRSGKTCLCQSLSKVEYFDCELPRVRLQMEDPEEFLSRLRGKRIVLDEIHRLQNPSELIKIAADHYRTVRVIATGLSSLGASAKFKDTLAGRKTDLWLTPMLLAELKLFGNDDFTTRALRGGLPPFFLSDTPLEREYQEWLDAYWAKDILELFRLERRASFQRLMELLFANSGGIFEATHYASPCEVNRTTIQNYLAILEATYVMHVVRPFNTHRPSEIIAAPRVYAFDTGFICCFRGWDRLRREDMGHLWEHLVLNELHALVGRECVRYWRDKRGHEVDFVVSQRGRNPVAIECKWSAGAFSPEGLLAFRRQYPEGENLVVSHDVDRAHSRKYGGTTVVFESPEGLWKRFDAANIIA